MDELTKNFQIFHNYKRLSDAGLVPALTCTRDGYELWTQLGAFDELVLKCHGCGSVTVPGQLLIDRVKKVVDEYVQ